MFGIVRVEIDTAHVHGCIGGRCGDDNLLSTTFQVSRGLIDSSKDTLWEDKLV